MPSSPLGFSPAGDPFGRTAPLAFESTYPVLGVPLRVRSNAQAALELAHLSFGAWRALDPTLVEARRNAKLDIIVLASSDERDLPLPERFVYRRHGPVFLAGAGTCLFSVLLHQQHAICFVPPRALDHEEWFTAHVNGCGVLAASQRDRVPVHAAAVVCEDRAFLVLGPSGGGKSTLAFACATAGFRVLSDDSVFVSLKGPGARLWGYTRCAWLDPLAVRFFPELAGRPAVVRANGKRRIPAPALGPLESPILTHAGAVTLVRLERGPGGLSLAPLPRADIANELAAPPDEGFDQFPEGRPAVVDWLTTLPAYRLVADGNPVAAADLLRRLGSGLESEPFARPATGVTS